MLLGELRFKKIWRCFNQESRFKKTPIVFDVWWAF